MSKLIDIPIVEAPGFEEVAGPQNTEIDEDNSWREWPEEWMDREDIG